jgi:hypothetical protein
VDDTLLTIFKRVDDTLRRKEQKMFTSGECLGAKSGKGGATISGKNSRYMMQILGTGCSAIKSDWVNCFMVALPPGKKEALIAIKVRDEYNPKGLYNYYGFFIRVYLGSDNEIHANLNEMFVPRKGRIAQIVELDGRHGGHIIALVGNKKLTTSPEPKPGEARVSADAICEWLIGDIDDATLLAASEEVEAEISARQLVIELKQEREGFLETMDLGKENCQRNWDMYQETLQEVFRYRNDLKKLIDDLKKISWYNWIFKVGAIIPRLTEIWAGKLLEEKEG